MEGKMKLGFNLRNVGILGRNLYVGTPTHYSTIDTEDIVEYASKAASVTKSCMLATFVALYDAFEYYLCNGHSFKLDGIGTFSLSLNASVSDPTAANVVSGADAVTAVGINFLPCKEMKTLLSQISWVSVVNKSALTEFTDFVARKISLGSDNVNLLNADPTEAHSLAIGDKIVLAGWNCPTTTTVKVEGIDSNGSAVSEEFTMQIVNTKDRLAMVATANATVAIATVQKITVDGVEYEYAGTSQIINVTAGANNVFSGASFVADNYVLTFKGNDTTGLTVSLDGADLVFASNTGKVAKTAAMNLTVGEHVLIVNGETIKFTCTAEVVASVTALSANGVTVQNGETSGMRKGVSYAMVVTGQNLDRIATSDITLPEGSTMGDTSLSYDNTRLEFTVVYGGTEGAIKIGSYFTVNITTTSTSTSTVESVGGISDGGTLSVYEGTSNAVVGTGLTDVTVKVTNQSTGVEQTSGYTWTTTSETAGKLTMNKNGSYNVVFYNADGDSIFTLSAVVTTMD